MHYRFVNFTSVGQFEESVRGVKRSVSLLSWGERFLTMAGERFGTEKRNFCDQEPILRLLNLQLHTKPAL
jgi:hypothetical protein